MPRPPRIDVPGSLCHTIARGSGDQVRKITAVRREIVINAVKMGAPAFDDRCVSSLLAVGDIEDCRAQSLRKEDRCGYGTLDLS
jgi:hypothetical protein